MPAIPLSVGAHGADISVLDPSGGTLQIPHLQFRCLLELPGHLFPQDAIVDAGAPLIIFPQAIWGRFQPGRDYEVLPFAGPNPSPGRVLGWQFTFQFARFLVPLAVMDAGLTTRVPRPRVVAAFASGDPPSPAGRKALPPVVLGLWGGVLEDGRVAVHRDPTAGIRGELHYP